MENRYVSLDFRTGQFFEYNKEEKEGYEKHVSTKGNTSYRKYYKDGVKGVLQAVSIYESKFGHQISMRIVDGDDGYYVPVNLYDQRNNVDSSYAESLIKLLPNLKKNDEVVVKGYNFVPEGEQYAKIGISITANGEKVKGALKNSYYSKGELVENDIPPIVWKKDPLGKNKPSAASLEAKDEYLLAVLANIVDPAKLGWTKDSDNAPAQQTKQEPVAEDKPKYQVPTKRVVETTTPSAQKVSKTDLPF